MDGSERCVRMVAAQAKGQNGSLTILQVKIYHPGGVVLQSERYSEASTEFESALPLGTTSARSEAGRYRVNRAHASLNV